MFLTEQAELERLDRHFVRVLRWLHNRSTTGLTRAQRVRRASHLSRLGAYRERGLFPKNRRFPGRLLPHFIDESGTRCAMAHLIEASGGRDLVQHVVRERNYARIHELRTLAELASWLDANGLDLEEAARIQPSYCATPASCVCGDAFYAGMVQGSLADGGTTMIVSAVYGTATGVQVGDVVPLNDPSGVAGPTDVVFASWDASSGAASVEFVGSSSTSDGGEVLVTVPVSACTFPQSVTIPGTLPVGIVTQALSAPDIGACEQTLAQYDPAWVEIQGCSLGEGGTAGSIGAGGSGGSGATSDDAGPRDAGAQARADSGGGCGLSQHAGFSVEAAIAISAALALYRARWRTRRR